MKVKTFHALTMQEAIRAIKEELGPDAIILSSKEVQQGGRLLRLFNRPVLEVMAAAEHEPVPSTKPAPSTKLAPAKPASPAVTQAPPADTGAPQAIASHDFQATLQSMLTQTPVSQPARSAQPS